MYHASMMLLRPSGNDDKPPSSRKVASNQSNQLNILCAISGSVRFLNRFLWVICNNQMFVLTQSDYYTVVFVPVMRCGARQD